MCVGLKTVPCGPNLIENYILMTRFYSTIPTITNITNLLTKYSNVTISESKFCYLDDSLISEVSKRSNMTFNSIDEVFAISNIDRVIREILYKVLKERSKEGGLDDNIKALGFDSTKWASLENYIKELKAIKASRIEEEKIIINNYKQSLRELEDKYKKKAYHLAKTPLQKAYRDVMSFGFDDMEPSIRIACTQYIIDNKLTNDEASKYKNKIITRERVKKFPNQCGKIKEESSVNIAEVDSEGMFTKSED